MTQPTESEYVKRTWHIPILVFFDKNIHTTFPAQSHNLFIDSKQNHLFLFIGGK